ncbi:membrane protein [Oceanobacillus picturae]|uniref:Membrane protein n=1 Tax=Oceanobacillus picturae TaxID=171693 RepID=A0A0U9H850_9BACI|nr:YfzA family protein [Oceanobacillus picturae]GAQ18176.1 membrane protein [Oceanobacillus picturae]
MRKKREKGPRNLIRKWVITIGGFVVMQIVFILTDGTFLEANSKKLGDVACNIVDSEFYYDWLILYVSPFFNIITLLAVLHIIFHGTKDLVRISIPKRSSN